MKLYLLAMSPDPPGLVFRRGKRCKLPSLAKESKYECRRYDFEEFEPLFSRYLVDIWVPQSIYYTITWTLLGVFVGCGVLGVLSCI